MNWQQVCLGLAAAGPRVDVWVTDDVMQFYDGDHLADVRPSVDALQILRVMGERHCRVPLCVTP